MKGSWISPKVRERHIVCNILLAVFFAPLIIIDLYFICLVGYDFIQYGLSGILALIGVYGILLRNKWNGFLLGVVTLFSICTAIIANYNYEMSLNNYEWSLNDSFDGPSKVQAIVDGMIVSCLITFIVTLPIFLSLLISKNGVSAIKLLEGGGIITKCGIEVIVSILMCCIVIVTSC